MRRVLGKPLVLLAVVVAATGTVVATAAPPPSSAPRTEIRGFRSTALRGTEHVAVALPRGYARGHRHYPVIYFLHGLPGNGSSLGGERLRRLAATVDRGRRAAIVVAVQGARAGDTDPEWHNWGRGRNWEDAVGESVRYVDRHYRTIPMRGARALIGLSAGGYGAAIIGFHHPESFSVTESWSGYFHPTTPDGRSPLDVGGDRANRLASAHAYVPHALAIYARHPTFLGFYVGDHDQRFLSENKQFAAELDAAHVPHAFAVYPGTHSGGFWDQHEDDWIMSALEHLAPAH